MSTFGRSSRGTDFWFLHWTNLPPGFKWIHSFRGHHLLCAVSSNYECMWYKAGHFSCHIMPRSISNLWKCPFQYEPYSTPSFNCCWLNINIHNFHIRCNNVGLLLTVISEMEALYRKYIFNVHLKVHLHY